MMSYKDKLMRKYRSKPKRYIDPQSLHENGEFGGNRMFLVPEPKKDQITGAALLELGKLKSQIEDGCKHSVVKFQADVERVGFTSIRVCKVCGEVFGKHMIFLDYDDFCSPECETQWVKSIKKGIRF